MSTIRGRVGVTLGAVFRYEDEAEPQYVVDARLRAKEWCAAKNQQVRHVRVMDLSNPSARESREAALDWLKREVEFAWT